LISSWQQVTGLWLDALDAELDPATTKST